MRALVLLTLVVTLSAKVNSLAAYGTPLGYGSSTTGGGDQTAYVPTTTSELTTMLKGSNRVVQLTKIFDFVGTEGTTTEAGCAPWSCTPNPQQAIDSVNYCDGQTAVSVTYDNAAITPLELGSNITVVGHSSSGGIRGKGIRINGQTNVIVQNIKIYELNEKYVWGGDAITIVGAKNVWIDHNFVQKIGRQQLVMGYTASTGVTISNNEFDGVADYAPYCNYKAYWIWLFVGINDKLTVNLNYIHDTSGRGPHIGGTSGYYQMMHLVNNYYYTVDGHAIDPEVGSYSLAEGNYFSAVDQPVTSSTTGYLYAPESSSQASSCSSTIGRSCVTNYLTGSGTLSRVDSTALSKFSSESAVKNYSPKAASSVPSYVLANAGVGIVPI